MKRPVVVIVLSAFYALGVLVALIGAFSGQPPLPYLLKAALSGCLAVGLWQMKNWARRFVILVLSLGVIGGIGIGVAVLVPRLSQGRPVSIPGVVMFIAMFVLFGFLIRHLMSDGVRQHFVTKT